MVERTVGETGKVSARLPRKLGEVSTGELVLGGTAGVSAAAFGLAA
jgi:hypothetical protein